MQLAYDADRFGVRPGGGNGKREPKLTDEEVEQQEKDELEEMRRYEEDEIRDRIEELAQDKRMKEFEQNLMREKGLLPPSPSDSGNGSAIALGKRNPEAIEGSDSH